MGLVLFFKLYGGAGGETALCQPPASGGSQQDIGAFPAQRTAGELTGLLEFSYPGPLPAHFATGRAGSSNFMLGLATWWGSRGGCCWKAMARGGFVHPQMG